MSVPHGTQRVYALTVSFEGELTASEVCRLRYNETAIG